MLTVTLPLSTHTSPGPTTAARRTTPVGTRFSPYLSSLPCPPSPPSIPSFIAQRCWQRPNSMATGTAALEPHLRFADHIILWAPAPAAMGAAGEASAAAQQHCTTIYSSRGLEGSLPAEEADGLVDLAWPGGRPHSGQERATPIDPPAFHYLRIPFDESLAAEETGGDEGSGSGSGHGSGSGGSGAGGTRRPVSMGGGGGSQLGERCVACLRFSCERPGGGDDLKTTLSTEVGRVGFLSHLQSEYSEGSLLCYEACVAFKAAGEPTNKAEGVRILDTYIKANGDDPINVSSDQRGVIEAAFAESARGGKPVTSDVFEFAEKALYTLMERDNHVRYKNYTRAKGGTSMMGYGAMIIVSQWPFFQSFGTLLRDMVVSAAPAGRTFLRWDLERATRLAVEARHIVNRIPAPPPGASRVYVRLRRGGGRTIRLSRPSWNRPPLLEADVGDLLAALGPEHMCSVVCAVLAEMKIIVRRQREHRRGIRGKEKEEKKRERERDTTGR